jgi:hypothetical protein
LDVSNVFHHDHLQEQVYCHQPIGFIDIAKPDAICSLSKSLYNLKQASCACFTTFTQYAKSGGFNPTRSDSSLFVFKDGAQLVYLLHYIDDMILAMSSTSLLCAIISCLWSEFAVKDMGTLGFFLGVDIRCSSSGFFLSQEKYAKNLLKHASMGNSKAALTPVDMADKLPADVGLPVADLSEYHSLASGLQYLTITRPDIAYVVQQVCLHMHDPHASHLPCSSACCAMCGGQHLSAFISVPHRQQPSPRTQSPIGLDAQIRVAQHRATASSSPSPLSHG